VVGIPGRIVYRSGVRVNPLEHGSLPDSEAAVIRALVDRLEMLEQQVQNLASEESSETSLTPTVSSSLDSPKELATVAPRCRIQDQVIQQYLDGAGI
jgi:serine O-acetyltransferase